MISSTNRNYLLRIVTNEIASFCIDDRLRQMALFCLCQSGLRWGKGGFRVMLKYFEINKSFMCRNLFRYYIKQIDSILPCVCSAIGHRRRQNVVRTSVTHSAVASGSSFLFLPYFDVICDLLLNRRTATWNYSLTRSVKFHYVKETHMLLAFWR